MEKNPLSLDNIIAFLESTKDDKWCTEVVRTNDGKGCVMSHIFDMGGNFFWNMFEEMYATTYMIYPVNDGEHPDYQQPTPKERVIAYLKDIKEGKRKTTHQIDQEIEKDYCEAKEPNQHLIDIEKK